MVSISERMAAMHAREAQSALAGLEAHADELAALGITATPEPVHVAAVGVLKHLITLGGQYDDGEVPMQLRVMLRSMAQLEPMFLSWIARVPVSQMEMGLRMLRDEIDGVLVHAAPPAAAPSDPVAAPAVDVQLPYAHDDGEPATAGPEPATAGSDEPGPDQSAGAGG